MKYLLIIIGLLFSASESNAQEFDIANIPLNLFKNANTIIRKDYYKFEVIEAGKIIKNGHQVATILNDVSSHNMLVLGYDSKRKILRFDANVYDARGKLVRKYSKKDATDESAISSFSIYEDDRVLYHDIGHSSYPYTVEFIYEMKESFVLYYPSFSFNNFYQSIEFAENVAIVPEELGLRYQSINGLNEPNIEKTGGKIVYTWSAKNIPAQVTELYAPPKGELIPGVIIGPNTIKYDEYEGKMDSWSSYGKFYYELNKNRDQLSPELVKKVKALTQDLPSDKLKIAALYEFLQKNTRYVSVQLGIGGWQTFDANYVEENQYGDCKALTNFMKALLKAADIQSYSALIHSSKQIPTTLDTEFPVLFANHVILYIPKEKAFLECTSSSNPPFFIGSSNANRQALLITAEGGELIPTPVYSAQDNLIDRKMNVTIDDKGEATVSGTIVFNGTSQEYFRYLGILGSKEEQEEAVQRYLSFPGMQLNSFEYEVHPSLPRTTINFSASNIQVVKKMGSRLLLGLNLLGNTPAVPEEIENRRFPVVQKGQYASRDEIRYSFSTSLKFDLSKITPVNISAVYGKYDQQITSEENSLIFKRNLKLNAYQGSVDSYTDYRDFLINLHEADQPKIILTRTPRP